MINHYGWIHKLKSSKLTLVNIFLLGLIIGLAVFAFIIIPDKTENANRQIPQIALSPPCTNQSFILLSKELNFPKENLFTALTKGRKDREEYIPYDTVYLQKEGITSVFRSIKRFHEILDENEKQLKTRDLYFLMGTDKYGRDVFSRLILGLRVSLVVGFFSVIVSVFLGIIIGSIGGYYGGWIDKIIMLIINTSWSIPTLLMAFAIILALGKGFLVIVLAVGLTMWVDVARIVRGQTLQVKNELYIKASKALGFDDFRIITRHILPNIMGSILVMTAANFATAILVEAGLSFLGLGIQPPMPSLGNMLQESYAYATGGFVYLATFPILTIMTLVLCFNLLGTGLRDVFDIKTVQ